MLKVKFFPQINLVLAKQRRQPQKQQKQHKTQGFYLGSAQAYGVLCAFQGKPGPHSLDRCPQSSELNPSWSFQCHPLSSLHAFPQKLFQIRSFDCALRPILELAFVLGGSTSPGHVLSMVKWSITNSSMTRLAQTYGPGRTVPSWIMHSVPVSQEV